MSPDGSRSEGSHKEEKPETGSINKTEAALMPRDSNWMFICWEIPEQQKKELGDKFNTDFSHSRLTIRVHDMTSGHCFDTDILPEAKNWYLNVTESGHAYYCEIGYKIAEKFEVLAKTNSVKLPPANLTGLIGEKIHSVSGNIEKLLEAGVDKAGAASENLAKRWDMIRSVFSRANAAGIQKDTDLKPAEKKDKEHKTQFWLAADCELVVFGATERNAEVTVGGRKIYLNPDGTFTARFSFPDGLTRLNVKALSADKTQSKNVIIEARRSTDNKSGLEN